MKNLQLKQSVQQEAGMVHGYVRCHKLLVAAHTDSSFVVRLADPGPPRLYTKNEWVNSSLANQANI